MRVRSDGRPKLFADYLAEGFGCSHSIEVSTDDVWPPIGLTSTVLRSSVVTYELGSEWARSAPRLVQLRAWLDHAPVAIVVAHPAAPVLTPAAFERYLLECQHRPSFVGWTDTSAEHERQLIAVLDRTGPPRSGDAPAGFRVVAFIPTYNEADIIRQSLQHLTSQNIGVYVIDNWSTDATADVAREFIDKGVIAVEQFPPSGPLATYEWRRILRRIEQLTEEIDADWFVLQDADERRASPWPGVRLIDGLHHVDACGFTCIDHIVLHHWPVRERFDTACRLEDQLPRFTFSNHLGHYHQRKAWKNLGEGVSLADSAGHDARFTGRTVYPFKFVLHHYPIRSQQHGERKVFADRMQRWSGEERALGWHQQYDGLTPGDRFVRDTPGDGSDEATFQQNYLIERLSGIGVFGERPWWATNPR